jgi:hypothetical protein
MTCRAIPAPRKGHGRQGSSGDNVARGASKGRTLERRQWTRQESSNGIRDRDLKEQLCQGSKKAFKKTFRKTVELEVAKQIAKTSIRFRKLSVRAL